MDHTTFRPRRKNVRVLHLSTVHRALDSRIFHREARSLAHAGYDVTVMAQHPGTAVEEGIAILPVRTPRSRIDRILISPWTALRAALRGKYHIVHIHDPELIPVGMILKLCGRIVVCDVHEDVPQQILNKEWLPRPVRPLIGRLMNALEPLCLKAFDLVVAVHPPVVARLQRARVRNVIEVQNFPWPEDFSFTPTGSEPRAADAVTATAAFPDGFQVGWDGATVIYAGAITAIRGAEQMIQAVHQCDPALRVRLVLAGPCAAKYLETLKTLPGWASTQYLGRLPLADVPAVMGLGQVGLVLLHPVPNHMGAAPTKVFEYMAAGLPVIASNFPPYTPIIDGARCGLTVDPLDVTEIAAAIERLIRDPDLAQEMGARGQQAVRTTYNWDSEATGLIDAYDRIAGISPATPAP